MRLQAKKNNQKQLNEPTVSELDTAKKQHLQAMAYHSRDGYGKNNVSRRDYVRSSKIRLPWPKMGDKIAKILPKQQNDSEMSEIDGQQLEGH